MKKTEEEIISGASGTGGLTIFWCVWMFIL
jgi:hypothetical protein